MLHLAKPETPGPSTVTVSFDAVRREHVQSRLYNGERLAKDEDAGPLARYLKPDRLVPLDPQIRTWAREVVDAAHAHTDLEMIRAIYDHVVATVKCDKTGKGWGRGDIYYACDARRGNCTDFHAISDRLRAFPGDPGVFRHWVAAARGTRGRQDRRLSLLGGTLCKRHRLDTG